MIHTVRRGVRAAGRGGIYARRVQELKPAYLITGSDRPKIETAIQRLRRHFDPASVELVTAIDTAADDVVALANAGSLFGDQRLVVVQDVDGRPNADNRLTGGWKAADLGLVVDYLADPSPTCVLALVGREVKADSPLGKAVTRVGEILAFGFVKKNLAAWVGGRFKQRGVRADGDACQALIHLVGEDAHALDSEVDKLSTWASGEPVTARDVERMVKPVAELPIYVLTDAWGRRDAGAVLEICEGIFDRDDKAARDVAPRLAAGVGSHVAKVKIAKRLAADGVRPKDALAELGTRSVYYADKMFTQAESFSDEELRDATVRLAALDLALKGDSALAGEIEIQRALADITVAPGSRDGAPRRS